jgi:hypothetical protein
LHTIRQQLDCIEEKIISPVSPKVEKPLISLIEKRKSLGLKTNSQKNIKKIEKMLFELKTNQASTYAIHQKKTSEFSDSNSISSHDSH